MEIEDNNNIDHSKFIPIFNECRGTCKTPIGCTCKPPKEEEEDEEIEIFATAKPQRVEKKETEENSPKSLNKVKDNGKEVPADKQCTCGKNPGGECGCKTGSGCGCSTNKEKCNSCSKSGTSKCCSGKNKLEVYDWLSDLLETHNDSKMVEVQFKNTRKGYYLNSNNLDLFKGDIVAVEATPGHDIGEVTLTGQLVTLQMKKNNFRGEIKRVYRIAKQSDLEKQAEARAKEHKTMLRAREIAEELKLAMKISDVEYQGDGNKAIFYYIADERVDFRQLIKVYASEFRVKIEMKQIGARQEAGRVGGIGPCGRELCCSSSMSNFISVSTSAARLQEIPLNPQKLAGQCGKLKCCLNFEVDTYVEAQRKLPNRDIPLETRDTTYYHFKTDVLSGEMTYSTDKHFAANLITVSKDRVHEVLKANKFGKKPSHLANQEQHVEEKPASHDLLDNESITRFDGVVKKKKKNKNKGKANGNGNSERNGNGENGNDSNRYEANNNSSNNNQPNRNRENNNRDNRDKGVDNRPQRENRENRENNREGRENNNKERDNNNQRNRNNRNNRNRPPRNNNKGERKDDNKKPEE